MKKILFTLSILVFVTACQRSKDNKNEMDQKDKTSLFFSSDSTVFQNIHVRQSKNMKDSILQSLDFKNVNQQWEKDGMVFSHLTETAFKIKVKDEKWVEEIKEKITALPINKVSENFMFGIQLNNEKPIHEVFFTFKNNVWTLKVFPRNRL